MKFLFRAFPTMLAMYTCVVSFALSQPVLYIVRHAEKLANWPERELGSFQPLSEAGIATSARLAKHFEGTKVAAIYSSPTTRTLHTVFPLSQKLGIPVDTVRAMMDTATIESFYAQLSKKFGPDRSVLLVTHSNIIPYLLMKAGLSIECFDNMGVQKSTGSSWLVIEGYDNIYRVEDLGKKRTGCEGITRGRF